MLDKEKKSKKIYEKLLRMNPNEQELLLASLKMFPQRAYDYMPLVLSINIDNAEIWYGLVHLAIKDKNYSMAQTYLNNAYYIDENDFRYYYYLSLVLAAKGETEKAKNALVKCSVLDSDYESKINAGLCVYEK
jgi:tetratricopeptide (TPR) repeat protein